MMLLDAFTTGQPNRSATHPLSVIPSSIAACAHRAAASNCRCSRSRQSLAFLREGPAAMITVLQQIGQGGIRGGHGWDTGGIRVGCAAMRGDARGCGGGIGTQRSLDQERNHTLRLCIAWTCCRASSVRVFCSNTWFARVHRSPCHIVRSATIYSQHSGWRSLIMKSSYSLAVVCAGILLGVTAAPCSLAAQAEGQAGIQTFAMRPAAVTATSGVATSAVGPIVEQAALHNASTESRVVADQDVGPHVNRGLALTVAGIAAVGVGYAVKGQAGTMIALGGGALALYGLYHWIK